MNNIQYSYEAKITIENISTRNFENLRLTSLWYKALFDATVNWIRKINQGVSDILRDVNNTKHYTINNYIIEPIPYIGEIEFKILIVKEHEEDKVVMYIRNIWLIASSLNNRQFIRLYGKIPTTAHTFTTSFKTSPLYTNKLNLGYNIVAIQYQTSGKYHLSGNGIKKCKGYDKFIGCSFGKYSWERRAWIIAERDGRIYKVYTDGTEIPYTYNLTGSRRKYVANSVYKSTELKDFYETIRESKFKNNECVVDILYSDKEDISHKLEPTLIDAFKSLLDKTNIQFMIEISKRGSFVVSIYPIDNTDNLLQLCEIFIVKSKEKQLISLNNSENYEKVKKLFESKSGENRG